MAFIDIPNVAVKGFSACVPPDIDENINYSLLTEEERAKVISSIGVERKRVAKDNVSASDLCYKAAEKLIEELHWDKNDIGCLIFVSQTPDYILPATSCLLQHRLGLNSECYTLDISLGCSGWVYGLSVLSSLLSHGNIKKGLLLVGDITTRLGCREDTSYWPLFGDAGTATAVEYVEGASDMYFHTATDGSGAEAIIIPDGAYRNGISKESLKIEVDTDGLNRSKLNTKMDGMDVFAFAVSKAPKSVAALLEKLQIPQEDIDCFVFHQANRFLNEKIRKKLKIDASKVPYSLLNYGNTSCATIPLTLVTERQEQLQNSRMNIVGCAFGVGLSWGSVYFSTENIICLDLIEY